MFKRFRYRRVDEETRMRYKETFLYKKDLILPVFIVNGTNTKREITSLPDVFHYSLDRLVPDLKELILKGLKSILVFGVTERKGIEQAFSNDGIIQKSIPVIKRHFPELEVITDVCLCSYTEDGHCHVGDNDATCEILAKIALSHATAGADIVAPSDMMDGRVHYIKSELLRHGLLKTGIMSYAAKFASSFYGPFREAANCTPKSGNRKTYQMDYSNSSEAIEEVMADIEEGADEIMIKPALAYLDIIQRVRKTIDKPIVAYNVSGEYNMIIQAIRSGYANEDIIHETVLAMKRAGADRIVSYFTPCLLEELSHG